MATNRYTGNAATIAQVTTLTPVGPTAGQTFKMVISNKTITYTASGAPTVAEVTAGLIALLATAPLEFQEVTWTDETTHVKGVASTAGKPFTVANTGSSGTLTITTTTTSSSPNDINLTANWSLAAVPVSTDAIVIENTDNDLLWNLDVLAAVVPASVNIRNYGGNIGLPPVNSSGYIEYRDRYLKFLPTFVDADTRGGRLNLNVLAGVNCHIRIRGTASSADSAYGMPACSILGTDIELLTVTGRADFGSCNTAGEVAAFDKIEMIAESAGSITYNLAAGAVVGILTSEGAKGTHSGDLTTLSLDVNSEMTEIAVDPDITTVNNHGKLNYECDTSSGTPAIGTYNGYGTSTIDLSYLSSPLVISTAFKLRAGASVIDPLRRLDPVNPIEIVDADYNDVNFTFGPSGFSFTI